jgi:hypothetical protein
MPDPVSWLVIRPGWKVFASDGSEIGEIDELIGDTSEDIFDGISISVDALGQPRYVDAEHVARIEQGEVHLSLDNEAAAQLPQYRQPATSVAIEPDDHHGLAETIGADVREIEGKLVEPTQDREHPFNFPTRVAHLLRRRVAPFFRRLRG